MTPSQTRDQGPAWLEVRLSAAEPLAEAAADFLQGLSGQGVVLEQGDASDRLLVRAFLAAGPELVAQKARVESYARELAQAGGGEVSLEIIGLEQEDWVSSWREHFKPRLVGRRIVVAPPWDRPKPEGNQLVIVIDPGQAFGTGQHASTQLVLRRLERLAQRDSLPAEALDMGRGSGILAIAAHLLGVGQVEAIDIDPEAIKATAENARLNHVDTGINASQTPLAGLDKQYPLVLANLTAQELMQLAQPLAARLAPGGEMVLSGVLVDQIQEVRKVFAELGLDMLETDSLAGWASLVMS